MYPEAPPNSPSVINKPLLIATIAVIIVLVLSVGFTLRRHRPPSRGTVTIQYTPADASNVSISISNRQQKTGASPVKYTLAPGSYSLKITAPGYRDFTATVPVTYNQTTLVNAQLQQTKQATITSPSQLSLPANVGTVTILAVQYYYNNSWAVARINTTYDSDAALVVQYDQASGTWKTVIGPALGLDPTASGALPVLIQQYLNDNGYIVHGD